MDPSSEDARAPALAPSELAARLARGEEVTDEAFDRQYPAELQHVSDICWTPLPVVREIVGLIRPLPETRWLDVGSGPGKFCIAGSLMAPGQYTGVEKKLPLHQVAVETGHRLGAERASFVLGNALEADWAAFDVLYFYNPFQEFLAGRAVPLLGWKVSSSREWDDYARHAQQKLRRLPVGRRVVLFHGLGTEMPDDFALVASGRSELGPLTVWRQT